MTKQIFLLNDSTYTLTFTNITSYPTGNLIVTIKAWKASVEVSDRNLDNPV